MRRTDEEGHGSLRIRPPLGPQGGCGLTTTGFMVRVGKERYREALALPHARPMDFTGRPLAGMVYVDPPGYRADAALAGWVQRGVDLATMRVSRTGGAPAG